MGNEFCERADVRWDKDCCSVGVGGGATVKSREAQVGWRGGLFQDFLKAEYLSVCLKVLRNDGVCCVLSFLYVVSCKFEMCFGDDSVLRRRWLSEVLFCF